MPEFLVKTTRSVTLIVTAADPEDATEKALDAAWQWAPENAHEGDQGDATAAVLGDIRDLMLAERGDHSTPERAIATAEAQFNDLSRRTRAAYQEYAALSRQQEAKAAEARELRQERGERRA